VSELPPPIVAPERIAGESFAIIRAELAALGLRVDPPLQAIVERVIHSTADFEFATITRASEGAVEVGLAALRGGCALLTDVRMVQVGVSQPRLRTLGGSLACLIDEPEVRGRAEAEATTRSALAIRLAHERGLLDGAVVAIGNAPTALLELLRLADMGAKPALIVGVPVGFVNTVESKEALMRRADLAWIATAGRKGGSTVAAAIVNALLRQAAGASNAEVD
jgi:precorrin-8X/cobalt-precorrin-8 methylmutase